MDLFERLKEEGWITDIKYDDEVVLPEGSKDPSAEVPFPVEQHLECWCSSDLAGAKKDQLAAIAPVLEQLWKQKDERIKEFSDVQSQILKICGEIVGNLKQTEQVHAPTVDEADLSLKKLNEFHSQLQEQDL